MAEGVFVAYYRVSTAKQGAPGLGLDAQRGSVADYVSSCAGKLTAEFTEVESGKRSDRQELARALQACRVFGSRLVIAKLDRLSRDAHFLLGLEKAGVDFIACDMPHANRLTVGIMAMVADEERRMISARTKAALQAAKARGQQLGGYRGTKITSEARAASQASREARAAARAADLAPYIVEASATGVKTSSAMARELSARGIPTVGGSTNWTAVQVLRLLRSLRHSGDERGTLPDQDRPTASRKLLQH